MNQRRLALLVIAIVALTTTLLSLGLVSFSSSESKDMSKRSRLPIRDYPISQTQDKQQKEEQDDKRKEEELKQEEEIKQDDKKIVEEEEVKKGDQDQKQDDKKQDDKKQNQDDNKIEEDKKKDQEDKKEAPQDSKTQEDKKMMAPISQTPVDESDEPIKDVDASKNFQDQAYVLLLTNSKPMKEIFALEQSFRDVNTTRRRIAMVTPAVGAPTRDTLTKLGIQIRNITQPRHDKFAVQVARWADTLAKLSLFDEADGLKKVIYMDADYILNYNIDHLFDLDTNAKVHGQFDGEDCFVPEKHFFLNAGIMVTNTNNTLKNEIFAMLDNPNYKMTLRKGDQELLDTYLKNNGMLRLLPEQDSTFVWRCACSEQKIVDFVIPKVKAVHFTGWWFDADDLIRRGEKSNTIRIACARPWYLRWVDMYRKMEAWWKATYPGQNPNF